jgi:hypothetical protein
MKDGEQRMAFYAPASTLPLVKWDLQAQTLVRQVSQPL